MAINKRPSSKTTRQTGSDRQKFENAVEIAEKLAARNAELERQLAARSAQDRKTKEITAGLPAPKDAKSITAYMAGLAQRCGLPWFGPTEGKFGGFSESDQRRIEEARRREALRAPKGDA